MASSNITETSDSSPPKWKYDVFVSFNDEDTDHSFTDNLFDALRRNNIVVFRDDTELLLAIESSQIFIVVFSKNYASSTWCLQELEHILLHCGQLSENPKRLLPVYLDVNPSVVKRQTGSYRKAFTRHEQKFGHDSDQVQRWREALRQAANISGWDLSYMPQSEKRAPPVNLDVKPSDVTYLSGSYQKAFDERKQRSDAFLRLKKASVANIPGRDLHNKQQSKKHALPVYLDRSGSYQKAFDEHKQRSGYDSNKFLGWRNALISAAGRDLHNKLQNEVIENIVKKIINILGLGSKVPKDVVGMDSRIQELQKCLFLDSLDVVRVVGIWGMGGVGKTTLARLLYGKISRQFYACCFINDVSRIYKRDGHSGLYNQILHQTLGRERHEIYNLHDATDLIQHTLRHRKALLVFDNVDHRKQLEKLAVIRESLGAGSIIIIVSRDDHILKEYGVDEVYQVPPLNQANSLQLFCQILSKHGHVVSNPEELAHDLLSYTNGLPRAIKALGSFLDGLDKMEKEIFLHIACFFNGREKDYVKNVLKCCDFSVEKGLTILIEKSLISITSENKIVMHALLEKLGKQIVHIHSVVWIRLWLNPHSGSWLWLHEQFDNVVSENMENYVEAVVLYGSEREKGVLKAETLSKMNHLRMLILKEVKFSGSLNYLSKSLRYVEWDEYPFSYLPPSFQCNELVELILVDSNIKQLWNGTKDLPSLRTLDLSYSENLTKMPYFGEFPSLKRLNLEGCIKLVQIDPSIGLLRELVFLNLKNCENLVCIPNEVSGLTSLNYLNLCGCSKASNNPNVYVDFASCLLPSLPSFPCLSELDVGFCCLSQIPDALGSLTLLERLNLRGNNFVTLPGLQDLSKLEYLNLEHCKQLTSLPELPSLAAIKQLKSLPELPSLAAIKQDKHKGAGILIFNCPKLGESEQYSNMIVSWTMHFIQANRYSSASFCQVDIVIPGREIPKWFNNRRMGRSISIDPYPFVYDENIIGIACCAIFSVEPFDLSTTTYEWGPVIRLGFKSSSAANCNYVVIPVTLFRYLIKVKSNHMWLIYFDREHFISFLSSKDNTLWELDHIKMEASATNGQGLVLEVKSCGYCWVFKQDQQSFGSHNNDELQKEESHKLEPATVLAIEEEARP